MNTLDLKYLFEDMDKYEKEHFKKYDEYLENHIKNVQRGYEWLKEFLPDVLSEYNYIEEKSYYGELDEIIKNHDKSKYTSKAADAERYYDLTCEYVPYADYFYGTRDKEVDEKFNLAWLSHIHNNPHHWQHWLLQNDEDGLNIIDMPYVFIVEMILDWWAFSWMKGNLWEIFKWYEEHKEGILISDKTRKTVEDILNKMENMLKEED